MATGCAVYSDAPSLPAIHRWLSLKMTATEPLCPAGPPEYESFGPAQDWTNTRLTNTTSYSRVTMTRGSLEFEQVGQGKTARKGWLSCSEAVPFFSNCLPL